METYMSCVYDVSQVGSEVSEKSSLAFFRQLILLSKGSSWYIPSGKHDIEQPMMITIIVFFAILATLYYCKICQASLAIE